MRPKPFEKVNTPTWSCRGSLMSRRSSSGMVPKSKVLLEQSDTSTAGGMASMTTCKSRTGCRLPVGGSTCHCAGRSHLQVAAVQQFHLACAGVPSHHGVQRSLLCCQNANGGTKPCQGQQHSLQWCNLANMQASTLPCQQMAFSQGTKHAQCAPSPFGELRLSPPAVPRN